MSDVSRPHKSPSSSSYTWRFADAELDEAARELRVHGQLVDVEPRPFNLLILLLQNAGEVVTTDEIIAAVWSSRIVGEATVPNAISKLRRLLNDDDRKVIATVSKTGYRLIAPVQRLMRTRVASAEIRLVAGDTIPHRPNWQLTHNLIANGSAAVWLATNAKTRAQRVFKFCSDAERLSAIKRELTIFRVLREAIGEKAPVPELFDWQFDNAPYYIELEQWGQDLRQWAEQKGGLQQIPLETRLRVLALTARAVATIHSVGVLHKDLKPHNILIREDSGAIEIRLCDFGTGLLLDSANLRDLEITRLGFTHTVASAGTPYYMAPELQYGGAPSVQSDIYSLGVVLYQLVVGDWTPLAFGWEADIGDELLRQDIAAAIHRDPSSRLPSAQLLEERLLALDTRRLELERAREVERRAAAVKAALERSRARRPWMIAASTALVLAVAVSSLLMVQARHAAQRANESALVANQNERIAQGIADFLSQDIVHQASPDYGGQVDVTLKKAVLDSVAKVPQRVAENAPLTAALDQSLAETLATLSDPVDAARLAHQAGELYGRVYGSSDRRTLSAQVDEISYRLLTEPEASVATAFQPIEDAILQGLPSTDLANRKAGLVRARLDQMQGRDRESLALLERLLSLYSSTPSADELKWLDRTRLAHVKALLLNNQYEPAKASAKALLPHFSDTYGANSRLTLELHQYLGRAYAAEHGTVHDVGAAEAEYETSVRGLSSLYGDNSTEVDFALQALDDLYIQAHRWNDAEKLSERLYADFQSHYGATSLWTWRARLQLLHAYAFDALASPEKMASAAKLANDVIALAKKTLSQDDYIYRHTLVFGAIPLAAAGHSQEVKAISDQLKSIEAHSAVASDEKVYLDAELNYLAGVLAQQRRDTGSAIASLQLAVDQLTKIDGPDGAQVVDANRRLAVLRN